MRAVETGYCGLLVLTILAGQMSVQAAEPPAHPLSAQLQIYEGAAGTTCSDFMAGILPWERRGGDWLDATGKPFGDKPLAEAPRGAQGTLWDLTAVMRGWLQQRRASAQLFVRATGGDGYAKFHSREAAGVADRPILALTFGNGQRRLLKPSADVQLDCSTAYPTGRNPVLTISGKHSALLAFALPMLEPGVQLQKAQLLLSAPDQAGSGQVRLGVFETRVSALPHASPEPGLAARYAGDQGIARDPEVIFASGFEAPWRKLFAADSSGEVDQVEVDPRLNFAPLQGQALRVRLKQGSNLGADLRLRLKDHGGEPEALFFRYYLRLASDWDPRMADGKLPGLSGTYGKVGWGGRKTDGSAGWSLRGSFLRSFEPGHPFHGYAQIGSYAYHADMQGTYGDVWNWPGALLERDRWYCVEQYVRLNRPDRNDGQLKVWIDGRPVFERRDLRLRTNGELRIEMAWIDVYHGGAAVSPVDQHLYIDAMVLARKYIGPMAATTAKPLN